MSTKDAIRNFILKKLVKDKRATLPDDASLEGIVNSLNMFELATFLEDEFEIVVEQEDVVPENFESVQTLASLVERRRSGA